MKSLKIIFFCCFIMFTHHISTVFFKSSALITNEFNSVTSFDIDAGGSDANALPAVIWQENISSGKDKLGTYMMLNEGLEAQTWHGDNTSDPAMPILLSATKHKLSGNSSKGNAAAIALNHQDYVGNQGTTGTLLWFEGNETPAGKFHYQVTGGTPIFSFCRTTQGKEVQNQYPVAVIGSTNISFTAWTEASLSPGFEPGRNIHDRLYQDDGQMFNCKHWSNRKNLGTGKKNITEDLCGAMSYAGRSADNGALVWKQRDKNRGIFKDLEELLEECLELGICEAAALVNTTEISNPRGHGKGIIRVVDNVDGSWIKTPRIPFPIGPTDLPGVRLSTPTKEKKDDDRSPVVVVDNSDGYALALWHRHINKTNKLKIKAAFRFFSAGRTSSVGLPTPPGDRGPFEWGLEFNFSNLASNGENGYLKASANDIGATVVLYDVTNGSGKTHLYFHLFLLGDLARSASGNIPSRVTTPRLFSETPVSNLTFLDVGIDNKGNGVATWVENGTTLKAAVLVGRIARWLPVEIIHQSKNAFTVPPKVKIHPSGSAFIVFRDPDKNGRPLVSTFNEVLPITMKNIEPVFLTHGFKSKNIKEDPVFSPSCESILNIDTDVIYEQFLNRTATQSDYFNKVTWNTDPVAAQYLVVRNDIPIATVQAPDTCYTDYNVSPSKKYTYSVIIFNQNDSPTCNKLTWDRHVGVTGYEILKDGVFIGSTDKNTTTFNDCDTRVNDQSCDNCPSPADCEYVIIATRPEKTPDCILIFWEPVLDGTVSGYNIYRSDIKNVDPCCLLGTVNSPKRFEFADCNKAISVEGCPNADTYTVTRIQSNNNCDRCNKISWIKPTATLNIIGYNVYKDGIKIDGAPCSATQCTPTVMGADTTEYTDCGDDINTDPGHAYFVVAVIKADDGTFYETFPHSGKATAATCSAHLTPSCPNNPNN